MRQIRRISRQVIDQNGDVVPLNGMCGIGITPGRAVVIKQGGRIIAYWGLWPEKDWFEYVRSVLAAAMEGGMVVECPARAK